jgi:outer membrane protein assembly factor BamD
MSDFNRLLKFDQEQSITMDAIKSFEELLKRFPKSKYGADGKEKLVTLRKQMAKHEMFIARFYWKRGLRVSAIPRLKEIAQKYTTLPEVQAEAMYYLAETYRAEESYLNAGQAYQNLIKEHPDSPYAQTGYSRLIELTESN